MTAIARWKHDKLDVLVTLFDDGSVVMLRDGAEVPSKESGLGFAPRAARDLKVSEMVAIVEETLGPRFVRQRIGTNEIAAQVAARQQRERKGKR